MLQIPLDAPHNSLLDWVLIALFGIMSVLGSVVGYLMKSKLRIYDQHIEDAKKESEALIRLQEQTASHHEEDDLRFDALRDATKKAAETMTWLGDCILIMGQAQGVNLPKRP